LQVSIAGQPLDVESARQQIRVIAQMQCYVIFDKIDSNYAWAVFTDKRCGNLFRKFQKNARIIVEF